MFPVEFLYLEWCRSEVFQWAVPCFCVMHEDAPPCNSRDNMSCTCARMCDTIHIHPSDVTLFHWSKGGGNTSRCVNKGGIGEDRNLVSLNRNTTGFKMLKSQCFVGKEMHSTYLSHIKDTCACILVMNINVNLTFVCLKRNFNLTFIVQFWLKRCWLWFYSVVLLKCILLY